MWTLKSASTDRWNAIREAARHKPWHDDLVTSSQHHLNESPRPDMSPAVAAIPLSPDDLLDDAAQQSVGGLVRDVLTHLSTLMRAEFELARSEITAEVKKGLRGSVFFIIVLALVLLLLPFLLVTVALVIAIWLPEWAGFAIVTGLMVLLAGLFALLGYRKIRHIRAPQRTISSMRNTAATLKRRHKPAETSVD